MPTDADSYGRWKNLVPFLYDWFAHHRLVWPSLSVRWGAVLETNEYKHKQRLYLSEQTDGSPFFPNTLVVANAEVIKRRVAAAEHMVFEEETRSAFVKGFKTIIHPGEVNKMREFQASPNLLVTHTDAPELLVWNTETQPHRKTGPAAQRDAPNGGRGEDGELCPIAGALKPSRPDLVLRGHGDDAEFALDVHREGFKVASGGKDRNVLLWDVSDYDQGSLCTNGKEGSGATGNGEGVGAKSGDFDGAPSLAPKTTFEGHSDTVEDVSFHPSGASELCSVGDDNALIFWDARAGTKPAHKVTDAHGEDVHTVDWSLLDENLGALGAECCVHTFAMHKDAVTCVQWCPDQKGMFGSSADDGYLNVWDVNKIGAAQSAEKKKTAAPEIVFQHAGHKTSVTDFHWNPFDPMTIASVSSGDGGNTLQMWRMNDLIYRPEEEALAELEKHKATICGVRAAAAGGGGEGGGDAQEKESAEPTGDGAAAPEGAGAMETD